MSAALPAFAAFEAQAHGRGFPTVLERQWPPGSTVADHTHDFAIEALVVQGEMWLTVGTETRHLRPGDRFALDRGVPHAERYGDAGATYWAARR